MIEEYGKFPNIAAFLSWQGEDWNPAIGTVNYIRNFQYARALTRYTAPINRDGTDAVIFIIDNHCPEASRTKLLDLMGRKQLYSKEEVQELGFLEENYYGN